MHWHWTHWRPLSWPSSSLCSSCCCYHCSAIECSCRGLQTAATDVKSRVQPSPVSSCAVTLSRRRRHSSRRQLVWHTSDLWSVMVGLRWLSVPAAWPVATWNCGSWDIRHFHFIGSISHLMPQVHLLYRLHIFSCWWDICECPMWTLGIKG